MSTVKTVLLPISGEDFGVPSNVVGTDTNFGKNCYVYEGEVRQRPGHELYAPSGVAPSGTIIHMASLQRDDSSLYMTRHTSIESEVFNQTTLTWDQISPSGTGDWTGVEGTDYFSSTTFTNNLYITNGVDSIRNFDGSGYAVDASGAPPKAKYIESSNSYLLLANITDSGTVYPKRVQWCDSGDAKLWVSGNAGDVDLDDDNDAIVGIKALNSIAVVYKENSIYVGALVDNVNVWQFERAVSGVGILNERCVVEHDGKHWFMTKDGNIGVFNGVSYTTVGDKVRSQVFNRLNPDKLGACHARKNEIRRTIEFFITTGSSDWPIESWHISYEDGAIFQDTLTGVTATEMFRDTSGQVAWDDDAGSWNSDVTRWDDGLGGSGFIFPLISRTNGNTYKEAIDLKDDAGTAIDQEFESKDFSMIKEFLESQDSYKRWLQISPYIYGDSVLMSYSVDSGLTWESIPYSSTQTNFTLTSALDQYQGYFDKVSMFVRFRFTNTDINSSYTLRQFSLRAQQREDSSK